MKTRDDIKKICRRHEISQAELARRLGVTKMAVSFWMRGNCSRCASLLVGLLASGKISLDEIAQAKREVEKSSV